MRALLPSSAFVIVCASIVLPLAVYGQSINPVPFLNQPFVPASVPPGSLQFMLTVNGGNFVSGSIVQWNGQPLATTYNSFTQLMAVVPSALVATAGNANVTVLNPGPGERSSIPSLFTIAPPVAAPSFQPVFAIAGISPTSIVVADFNGDGKADIAVTDGSTVTVELGNGDGTFTPSWTLTIPEELGSGQILVADFNNDGKLDLAFSSAPQGQSSFDIALGNGDGTFQTPSFAFVNETTPYFVIGDFNRDGNLDVANFDLSAADFLAILLGDGQENLNETAGQFIDPYGGNLAVGDFNHDGILDLAAGTNILLGNGDGTFVVPNQLAKPQLGGPALVADFNGDGIPDLMFAGGPTKVLLGNGNATFAKKKQTNPFLSSFLVAGDFNNDGKLDVAFVNGISPRVFLALGNGDGTFQPVLHYPVTGKPQTLAVGDFNNDGRLDLIVPSKNGLMVLLQTP